MGGKDIKGMTVGEEKVQRGWVVDINVEVDVDLGVGIESMIQLQAYERIRSGQNERILHHDLHFSG
jgi:hypothetical protein